MKILVLALLIALTPARGFAEAAPQSALAPWCAGELSTSSLGSYDETAWLRFVDDLAARSQNYDLVNGLVPTLVHMPGPLRDKVLRRAGEVYAKAGKDNMRRDVHPQVWLPLAPKRALDALLTGLIPAARLIGQGLDQKLTPLQAYEVFLRKQRTKVFARKTHGNYRAQDVARIASHIQQELVELERETGRSGLVAVMMGSLPSGRADLQNSDIDLGISEILPDPQYQNFLDRISSRVRLMLLQSHGEIGLLASRFKGRQFYRDGAVPAYAHLSPVQIRITSQKIELLVWDHYAIDSNEIFDGKVQYPPKLDLRLAGPAASKPAGPPFSAHEIQILKAMLPAGSKWLQPEKTAAVAIGKGQTNRALKLLHRDGDTAVLRYRVVPAATDHTGALRELQAGEAAARLGVGPKTLFAAPDLSASLQQYIAGEHPHYTDLHKPEVLSALIKSLRRVHSYREDAAAKLPPLKSLAQIKADFEAHKMPSDLPYIPELLALETYVAGAMDILSGRSTRGLVHGDLHPGNMKLDSDGKMWLIDWGSGGIGDPFSDLGNLASHMDLDREKLAALLTEYLQRKPLETEIAAVQAWRFLANIKGCMASLANYQLAEDNYHHRQAAKMFLHRAQALTTDPIFSKIP